jgi:hypothetical protein
MWTDEMRTFEGTVDQDNDTRPKFADEQAGRFGIRTTLVASALACFIAAIWYMKRPG